jgi:ribosomal-protein-alanine N-acetyltransferase
VIETKRFVLRPLTIADATERYWRWLQDEAALKYIAAAATTRDLAELRGYIAERIGRDDVLFLGIFDRESGLHIGNIKYEPLDSVRGYAVMGILLGEPTYRGKGVTPEVLEATGWWLAEHRGIREIVLGVHRDNSAAIRAYQRVGFAIAETPHIPEPLAGTYTMVWQLRRFEQE